MALYRRSAPGASTLRPRAPHHFWTTGSASSGCLGFFPLELGVRLEVTLSLVLAEDPRFVHARLEAPQHRVEGLSFAWLDVHQRAIPVAIACWAARSWRGTQSLPRPPERPPP